MWAKHGKWELSKIFKAALLLPLGLDQNSSKYKNKPVDTAGFEVVIPGSLSTAELWIRRHRIKSRKSIHSQWDGAERKITAMNRSAEGCHRAVSSHGPSHSCPDGSTSSTCKAAEPQEGMQELKLKIKAHMKCNSSYVQKAQVPKLTSWTPWVFQHPLPQTWPLFSWGNNLLSSKQAEDKVHSCKLTSQPS